MTSFLKSRVLFSCPRRKGRAHSGDLFWPTPPKCDRKMEHNTLKKGKIKPETMTTASTAVITFVIHKVVTEFLNITLKWYRIDELMVVEV